MSTLSEAFFVGSGRTAQGADRYEARDACIGPWSARAMHGGPPSALLVRACERVALAGDGDAHDGRAAAVALRVSVDFLGPVPMGPVEVAARVVRPGRRIMLAEASLSAGGRQALLARTWLVAPDPDAASAAPGVDALTPRRLDGDGDPPAGPPPPLECPSLEGTWTFEYARALEWRLVSGDVAGPGDAAVWVRARIPLLAGEEPSGLQRACLIADSGNGISAALDWDLWSFVNIDLDVRLSRPLSGDWVLLDARSRYQPGGAGLATSVLSDRGGVVGAGAQTLVVSSRRRQRGTGLSGAGQ